MTRSADDVSKLLAAHGERLFALLVRLTLRYDVAEDLLQDLFCKLMRSNSFQHAVDPLAYAHRAATNLAFDWRRSKKQHSNIDGNCENFAVPQSSPIADLIRREELDQVLNAIALLPPPGQEIIVLRYLEHESYETIAQHLGKTNHQVRAIAYKAVTRLRELLGEQPNPTSKNCQRAEH